jgi:DNA-binding response OmpR family regulator
VEEFVLTFGKQDQVVTKPFRIPELVPQMEALVAETAALRKARGG